MSEEERLSYSEAMDLIDEILKFRQDKLTEKEFEFIESIERNEGNYSELTGPMTKYLNDIFDRVMR